MRSYMVSFPSDRGLRFMTHLQLHHYVRGSLREHLPDIGQVIVYNDLHPFGANVKWQRVEEGMTVEEMVDSNLAGERVFYL